ncbi:MULTISPECIES: hypothetical protein [unclassified Leifsonia]|uniref:hypothetical protein n=1 Tax=unclassified Leifsonia TaxID=2663824 RepID=UPI0006FFD87E|nr:MULTISPECIES: hypothetical protein [unclassified Leifsonia]KQX08140.1 hypothetical protein ASC59_10725 [Leifsonia sp. Root1293]KRA12421.1 hypothetical protein ASD61_10725 [Leifsonia sp. Root60]
MNTQLLTARDTQSRAQQYTTTGLDRLARRAGLALVRWSSRSSARNVRDTQLSSHSVQNRREADSLRRTSTHDTQLLVLLSRGQF